MNKTVSVLGSTGSIGTQSLEVCEKHNFRVAGLSANNNTELLEMQTRKFKPEYVCIYDDKKYTEMKNRLLDTGVKVLSGMDGLCEIASLQQNDIVLNSVVGMVGLLPTLTAINAGKDVALANKETLVAGGEIVMSSAREKGVTIYPVDSEHSAIFQCLQGNKREHLSKIILTASGGPFFNKTYEELKKVTKADALRHPNWSMGNKITIDSATLMNKGLEFIEAKWLFDLTPEQIEIVVHRQSVVHSAVEYNDYSVIAQLGVPDMKIPIQYALLYPDRLECPTKRLSLTDYGSLTFEKPDYETFKCLSTAIKAIEAGGAYPCLVNSANEEAVKAFLNDETEFMQ
ncbi:MAG: 1-deoxy-D-xylulose-5-phosphate reductoisomerase, partial [Prevotella sp.]|nr:1-deoxy-D-xylulose-5-phosphate reductoisomerase [Prevotella sp.]